MRLQLLNALALAASYVFAKEFDSANVKALTANNFKKTILGSERAAIAAFYAPWCGHCKRLAPEYEKAAKNMAGLVDFVAVDCDQDKNKPLCQEYGVQGFPTVKVFSGVPKSNPSDYPGERTASALVQHMARSMPNYSKRIRSSAELAKLTRKVPIKPVVFLVTDKLSTPSIFKALSTEFHNTFQFYTIKDSPEFQEAKESFGITKTPSVLLWRGSDALEIFGGKMKLGQISEWLEQAAKSRSGSDSSSSDSDKIPRDEL